VKVLRFACQAIPTCMATTSIRSFSGIGKQRPKENPVRMSTGLWYCSCWRMKRMKQDVLA